MSTPTKKPEETTLGYPHIEKLLETEKFEEVNKSFSAAYETLEKIMKDRSAGLKKQKSAQKAMQAYEFTVKLMNYLLKVKHEMVRMREAQAKEKKK